MKKLIFILFIICLFSCQTTKQKEKSCEFIFDDIIIYEDDETPSYIYGILYTDKGYIEYSFHRDNLTVLTHKKYEYKLVVYDKDFNCDPFFLTTARYKKVLYIPEGIDKYNLLEVQR